MGDIQEWRILIEGWLLFSIGRISEKIQMNMSESAQFIKEVNMMPQQLLASYNLWLQPRPHGLALAWTSLMAFQSLRTKYGHCMALNHPYTVVSMTKTFMDQVFKLHDMAENIVSDRDPIFLSKFWQELLSLQGLTLSISSAYHP